MPRNVFKFSYEKGGIENAQNIEESRNFVKDYINTRASSGQFVNCKIYGDKSNGEVYTTWLFDNLPNKKELKLAEIVDEIAPTKQGFPCCIISRKLEPSERTAIQVGLKDYEVCYEFKMIKYSEHKEVNSYTEKGWKIRKWFDSLEIFTIADLENNSRLPRW